MMHTYKQGDTVRVVGQFSGISVTANVARVTPSGKQVHVHLAGRRMPTVFFFQPSSGRFFSQYDGYLFPVIEAAKPAPAKHTPLRVRMATERKVVRHLIRTAKAHGYTLVRVWDGEANVYVTKERAAMDAVFAVDDCRIVFRHPEEDSAHCAVIVLGNDGWDAIADCSMGERWDVVTKACFEYCETLSATP